MKWKLANLAGIDVYIHWTFWLLPAWVLLSGVGATGGVFGALGSVAFVFAIFACVLLHEFGHALMARQFRIGTRDITLYPIGGVASLERMPTRPIQELAIALAGPAVNVVIASGLFGLLMVLGIGTQGLVFDLAGGSFLVSLLAVNVALVIFNMLPAFPMDGGRVLRAVLAMGLPYSRATEIAARIGQALAVLLGIVGLFTGGTLVFVALFVFLAAQAELALARRMAMPSYARPWDAAEYTTVHPAGYGPADPQREIVWLSEVHVAPGDGQEPGTVRIVRVRP